MMDNTPNVATVTITVEEYFDLRMRAEQNKYLTDTLMRIEGNFASLESRVFQMEKALDKKGILYG